MRPIHPFPARMAPEAANRWLRDLPENARVLDPMCGSGVVLRQSALLGHRAIGFDIDPLAVLMSRVWTRRGQHSKLVQYAERVARSAKRRSNDHTVLHWVRRCPETREFIEYWFAEPQRSDLSRLAISIRELQGDAPRWIVDALYLSLSRIIVTKHVGASLAWDISHSRPHRVGDINEFETIPGFLRAAKRLADQLDDDAVVASAKVARGDCRALTSIKSNSIDAIVTSPPYLNAIDYLRGHKLSLVWMGYTIPFLRNLRSGAVGTERAGGSLARRTANLPELESSIRRLRRLPDRQRAIVQQYAEDADRMLGEMRRVLKPSGRLVLVLADSYLRGFPVPNSRIFSWLAERNGLRLERQRSREIPQSRRYLPIKTKSRALAKRMRHETIQVYSRA